MWVCITVLSLCKFLWMSSAHILYKACIRLVECRKPFLWAFVIAFLPVVRPPLATKKKPPNTIPSNKEVENGPIKGSFTSTALQRIVHFHVCSDDHFAHSLRVLRPPSMRSGAICCCGSQSPSRGLPGQSCESNTSWQGMAQFPSLGLQDGPTECSYVLIDIAYSEIFMFFPLAVVSASLKLIYVIR